MKLTFKDEKVMKFDELGYGQTFIDPDIDNSTVFVKAFPNLELDVSTDVELVGNDYDGFAVDLYTGEICGYFYKDEVIPVKVEATVTR